jgi:predicted metal-binding membrane protein
MGPAEPAATPNAGGSNSVADPSLLEVLLRRDRFIVAAGLVVLIVAAWVWILLGVGTGMDAPTLTGMSQQQMASASDHGMGGMAMSVMTPAVWTPGYAALIFSMWWIMMVAMMLPSATPMLLLFARVNRKEKAGGRPYVPTAVFAAGYLVAWGGFSAFATGFQWGLERLGLLSSMMVTTSIWLGGAILIVAGAWQLTPIKNVCLRHCRSPLSFLANNWRPGRLGAFRMGLEHGAYCLGCCWFLMGLLFFGGIMNPYWILGLAVFILIEKTIRMGQWLGWTAGVGLVGWGVMLLASAP